MTLATVSAADVERIIPHAGHLAPLYEAALFGIPLIIAMPGERVPSYEAHGAWILLVGDDLETSRGVSAFDERALRKYLARASHVVVHSGVAVLDAYMGAAGAAVLGGRAAILETQLRHHAEWWSWAQRWAGRAAFLDVGPSPEGTA